ncbi:MAG: hypothetical protein IJ641_05695 [Lachnospiraceae bacterium]|nr:hypothetical protein [Lachnospiraceae bacterium]
MNDPIMLTPHDLANIFLAICGAIVAVAAAVGVIIKIIDHFKEPDKKQDERITKLEEDVETINRRLEDGNKHFNDHDAWMKEIEEALKKRDKVMIESLQVLIEHGIDGNNIDGMKQQKHRLDKYLLEK